jgi:YfiH family protein
MKNSVEKVEVVRVPRWEQYGWLRHGFSTRLGGVSAVYGGGDLNLGFTKDDDAELVRENRRLWAATVAGEDGWPVLTVRQVHGTRVARVSAGANWEPVEADGLMTAEAGVLLGAQAADCVPILLVDTRLRVVAALHAGWRGTVAGMAGVGVARMREEFGSRVEDLVAAVGPSIGVCCYEVGDEVRGEFARAFGDAEGLFVGRHLDLWEANRRVLVGAGLRADAVSVVGECTGCLRSGDGRRKYFSHRTEKGFTGRAMGLVGVEARLYK